MAVAVSLNSLPQLDWTPYSRSAMVHFQFQQALFQRQPAAISRQPTAGTDYAVAWHYNRDRICAVGRTYGTHGFGSSYGCSDLSVAPGFTVGNVLQLLPYLHLEFGPDHVQRERELP
jgi:hypothetical protein